MELKVYAVPGGFKDEIRQQLSSAMSDAVIGRVTAGPGDTVIQNGTRHAWRNPYDEPCRMVVVLVGAHHDAMTS